MVKGVSRQVVVVKPQNTLFEEAIFILKEGVERVDEGELLREAVTAAEEYVSQNCEQKPRALPPVLFSVLGALITAAAWLLSGILR